MSPPLGACENCGAPCEEHDMGDAANCIAATGLFSEDESAEWREWREAVEVSLRASPDYDAALALFWWIRDAAVALHGDTWPDGRREDELLGAVERDEALDAGLPAERQRARDLRARAGGWWWARGGEPLFVADETGGST